MLEVAIVGSGFMARTHAERYRSMERATIAAVVSPTSADEFVREHGLDAEGFSSLETCLEELSVDAASVCSPTPTHESVVRRLAASGIDIFCEKPLASTLAEANAIADAVDDADVTLSAGHVLRFMPAYRRVRNRIEAGAIGTLGTARACRHSPFPSWGDGWFADDEQSGGVFLDLGIHEFDYLRWLFGDVERVFARRSRWGDRQNGHATLAFENGGVGYVEAGWDRLPEEELWSTLELAGDDGLLEYDSREPTPLSVSTETNVDPEPIATTETDGYDDELEAFLECVEQDTEAPVPIEDAIEAMRIALAATRSAERNEPIYLEEVTP